jgi:aminopeptidase YwaD
MKQNSITLFFFLSIFSLFSQEIKKGQAYDYARTIVDTMASESMHGRGYVNNGDKIAANYIKNEFAKFGLKSFTSDFYQSFSFSINTFPSEISVRVDDKQLSPGKDFIIYAHSPGSSGTYETLIADDLLVKKKRKFKKFLKQNFSDKIVIVNDTGKQTNELQNIIGNSIHAKAIVALKDKLTLSMAQTVSDYPIIEILRTSLNKNPKQISFDVKNVFIPEYPSQNVIGYVQGSVFPDSFIVFSAHYDHLGQMGPDVYFPGANDNASGCAMLLNLAKYYSKPENKPKYSVAFISFGAEEVGLVGSKYFTEHPVFSLKSIRFLLNMDIMGTGEDGITVVNGSLFKKEFEKLKQINTESDLIKEVRIRGKAANSDHYYFSENGVKAFFIYTLGGIKAYHDIYDRPETLPLNEFENLFKLIVKFGDYLQLVNQ